jgi:branched-chain amino acid transport system substrate-binding protein
VIADALSRAKAMTADDIRDALAATDMDTAFGHAKFENKNGYQNQNFAETLALQVIDAKHETIWPEKFASAKYVFPIPKWRERK